MIGDIFFTILYQPLYNLLVLFHNFFPWGGLGLSIILLTVVVKLLVLPLTYKSMKAQKEMQELQPKIAEIKARYKESKDPKAQEMQAKELMGIYKTHNVNPFASCLPTILQLVVFVTLFRVLSAGMKTVDPTVLYSFVQNPGTMGHIFLWTDLAVVSIPFAILAAVMQFFQARQMITRRPPKAVQGSSGALDEDMTASMNKMTMTLLPVMMLVMGVTTLPGGTTLYIFVSTLITYLMYAFFLKPNPDPVLKAVTDVTATEVKSE
jgi:YidC/Oxa1 family membrane protein insertase